MITDVLYSVNLYILFCEKRFELQKCYVLLLLCPIFSEKRHLLRVVHHNLFIYEVFPLKFGMEIELK